MYSGGSIQTTRADALLSCLGTGKYGGWLDIRVCNDAVKNICSAGLLRDMGYNLQLLRVPRVVRLIDGEEVLTDLSYVGLSDLLHLPNISRVCGDICDEVHLSDGLHSDPLEITLALWSRESKLLEGHRHMLFTGSGLSQKYLISKKFVKSVSRYLFKSCAKAKITRRSFHPTDPDTQQTGRFLEKVTADIAIYLNYPSRQGPPSRGALRIPQK